MTASQDGSEHELALLEPWRRAYQARYGYVPEARSVGPGLSTLTLRPESDPFALFRRMIGSVGRFRQKPRLLAHARDLGFDWDGDGTLLTVPLPGTFRRRMSDLGLLDSGFLPDLVVLDANDIPAGTWLLRLSEGTAIIQTGTRELYARERDEVNAGSERRQRSRIHHLLALHHDMNKHVLVCHLVPRASLLELGERAAAAMGRFQRRVAEKLGWARWLGYLPKECLAPVPLLTFYENDLVDYCHAVWNAIDEPRAFAPTFARVSHVAQLEDVLSRRIEQAGRVGLARGSFTPPRPYARFEIEC